MAEPKPTPNVAADDKTGDPPSKAPEINLESQDTEPAPDSRMMPGGSHGAGAEIGMSALDREQVPSGANPPAQTNYGESPDSSKP
jgi:hypothetical protein